MLACLTFNYAPEMNFRYYGQQLTLSGVKIFLMTPLLFCLFFHSHTFLKFVEGE